MENYTKLSPLINEQVKMIANENERIFLLRLLEKELLYNSDDNKDELKRQYKILLETHFPYQGNSENKEEK